MIGVEEMLGTFYRLFRLIGVALLSAPYILGARTFCR
jgi:hypothetical protein